MSSMESLKSLETVDTDEEKWASIAKVGDRAAPLIILAAPLIWKTLSKDSTASTSSMPSCKKMGDDHVQRVVQYLCWEAQIEQSLFCEQNTTPLSTALVAGSREDFFEFLHPAKWMCFDRNVCSHTSLKAFKYGAKAHVRARQIKHL